MFVIILTFLIVNVFFGLCIWLYNKLTRGICKSSKHLVGKVIVVTGANAGIGYETAKDLAERGARVILGCRDIARGTEARNKIVAHTDNEDIHFYQLDLASFKSIRAFAEHVIKTEKRLDILINNGGILESEYVKTEDGLLLLMQVNHFGPFLLTSLLLPILKASAPSRIINVSSELYKYGKIDFENLNMEKESTKTYSRQQAYSNSKLCNVLMTIELENQLRGTGVTANSLHPGAVYTDIVDKLKLNYLIKFMFTSLTTVFYKTPWEGAQTTIYLAVSPEVDGVSGYYYSDCRKQNLTEKGNDKNVARKLWEVSERLVKLNF